MDTFELVGGANGSYSGGFTVTSVKMPLITLVNDNKKEKVSDMFVGLAVPYWAFSQRAEIGCNNCDDKDDDVISPDLYDRLFANIQHYKSKPAQTKKHTNKKQTKQTKRVY